MKTVALFNNKGGVGKTTLAFHLAHMLQRKGVKVLAVDLDPQANLTAEFLNEDELTSLYGNPESGGTIVTAVSPILEGEGDVKIPSPVEISDGLWLLPGDLLLSKFEDKLSDSWPRSLDEDRAAQRATTAFYRIISSVGEQCDAEVAIIDVGPNLGALNRAALLSVDYVLIPIAADLFSLRGLENLGPTLRSWRETWQTRILPGIPSTISAPSGTMEPIGYVVMQPTMRLDRPVKAYQRWLDRIPLQFATSVLGMPTSTDSHEITTLRNYQSLMPLAHDARKPMFDLRAGDGAIGSTQQFVTRCYQDFSNLAQELAKRIDLPLNK
jgi:cellulose biosynthesis protein BcsQ